MRIVYDASSRATPNSPSLNDCLYPGPVLQNKLWDILIEERGYPVILAGDIRKAFFIHESELDALCFHWRADAHSEIDTYRFTSKNRRLHIKLWVGILLTMARFFNSFRGIVIVDSFEALLF